MKNNFMNKEQKREYHRKWREQNPEKVKKYHAEYRKKWRINNPDKERKYRKTQKEKWAKTHPISYHRIWEKRRRKIDAKFKLDGNMSNMIRRALRGRKAGQKWEKLVGYSVDDLIKHLERKFELWMSWDNYGKWHIDHIIPRSHFKYKTAEDSEFKKCWALRNLQPLDGIENMIKGDKIIKYESIKQHKTTAQKKS